MEGKRQRQVRRPARDDNGCVGLFSGFGVKPNKIFWMLCVGILILDQATKLAVQKMLPLHENCTVIPHFFDLTYVRNDGIAFGLLQGNNFLMGLLALGVLVLGLWLSRKLDWKSMEVNVIAAMIAGGAVGNLIDRVRVGHVIDFLDFHIGNWHWPAFNVADSCISLSVVYILLRVFLWRRRDNL